MNFINFQLHQNSPSESEFKEDDNETEPASHGVNNSSEQSKKKKKKRKKKNVKSSTNNQRRSSEDYSTVRVKHFIYFNFKYKQIILFFKDR